MAPQAPNMMAMLAKGLESTLCEPEARCEDCQHPQAWHGRHGCYAISGLGACGCKSIGTLNAPPAVPPQQVDEVRRVVSAMPEAVQAQITDACSDDESRGCWCGFHGSEVTKAPAVPQGWQPTSKPPEHKAPHSFPILVWHSLGGVSLGHYTPFFIGREGQEHLVFTAENWSAKNGRVTHWMPRPAPPAALPGDAPKEA